jgi:hypothetical protein
VVLPREANESGLFAVWGRRRAGGGGGGVLKKKNPKK